MPPRAAPARQEAEKNEPLVADIRLLGRILGDVIREQEGREAYELVERIRQLSVAYRHKHDKEAGKRFDKLLKSLSGEQAVSVIRAFSYFSHLANIAEDRHHIRRRDVHERAGSRNPARWPTAWSTCTRPASARPRSPRCCNAASSRPC